MTNAAPTRTPATSRTVVPSSGPGSVPNFRDNGRMVDTGLLRLVNRLQTKYGRAFVSERSLREMLFEDTGMMAGVSTLPKAIVRLGQQGLIVQVWLLPGQLLPDGSPCTHGARLVWCPQNRRQRLTARSFNADQNRREGERNRTVPPSRADALIKRLAAGTAPAPAASSEDLARARLDAARAAAAELAAQWAREDAVKKPPD